MSCIDLNELYFLGESVARPLIHVFYLIIIFVNKPNIAIYLDL